MQLRNIALLSCAAWVASSPALAGFTGFSIVRGQANPNGNVVWELRANFNSTGLAAGQSWVFLNAFNWTTLGGSLNALHSDANSSWNASATEASFANTDSFVTATGTYGEGTALDPSFSVQSGSSIPHLAGWYDATPGAPNMVAPTASYLIAQIVRAPTAPLFIGSLELTYKVSGTATAIFGDGTFVIPGVPAPGALALLGTCGLVSRRRR